MGQEEDSLSAVRSSGVACPYNAPLRIEPQRGKVSEDDIESPNKEGCDVLHEDVPGSNLANDAREVNPESAALAADPGSFPGVADVLAGEAASDEIHDSTPRATVEGGDIRPDRCRMKPAVFRTRRQDCGGIGFVFHAADRASDSGALKSQVEPAPTGKKGDGT